MKTPLDMFLISGNLVLNSKYTNDISFGLINKNLLKDNCFLLFEVSYFLREKKIKYSAKLQILWFLIEIGMRSKDSCFISIGWCCDKGSILIGADKKLNKTCLDIPKLTSIKNNQLQKGIGPQIPINIDVMTHIVDEPYETSSVCSVVSSSMEYQRGDQNCKNFSHNRSDNQKFNSNDYPFEMNSDYLKFYNIFKKLNSEKKLSSILQELWYINNKISSEYLSFLFHQKNLNLVKSDSEQFRLLSTVNSKFNTNQIQYLERICIKNKLHFERVKKEDCIKKHQNYIKDKSTNSNQFFEKNKNPNLLQKSFCRYNDSDAIPYYEGVEAKIKSQYIMSKIHLFCSYISKLKLAEYKNFDSKDDFSYNLYSFNLFEFLKTVSAKLMSSLAEFFSYKSPIEAIKQHGIDKLIEKITYFLKIYSENELKKKLNKESYLLMKKITSYLNIDSTEKAFVLKKEIEKDKREFIINTFEFMKTIVNQEINFFQLLYTRNISTALKLFKPSIVINSVKTYLEKDNSRVAQKWKKHIGKLYSEQEKIEFIKDIFQKYKDLSVLYVLLQIQNNEKTVIKFDTSDLLKIEESLNAQKCDLITVFHEYLNVPNLFDLVNDSTQKQLLNDLNFYYSAYKMFQNNTNLLSNYTNLDEDKKKLVNSARFGYSEVSYRAGSNNLSSILNRNLPSNQYYNTLSFQKEELIKYQETEFAKRVNSLFKPSKDKEKVKAIDRIVKDNIIDFSIEDFVFNFFDRDNTFEKHIKISESSAEFYLAQVAFANIYTECISKLEKHKICFKSLINYAELSSYKKNECIKDIEKKLLLMKDLAEKCIDKLKNESKRQVDFYKNTALNIGLRGNVPLLKKTINTLNINSYFLDLLKNSNDGNKSEIYIAMILNNLIYGNIGDFASDYPFIIEAEKLKSKKERINNLEGNLKAIDKIFISSFIHYTRNNSDYNTKNNTYYDFFKNIDSIKYIEAFNKNDLVMLQSILQEALLNYDLSQKLNYLYSLSLEYIENNSLFQKRKKKKDNDHDKRIFIQKTSNFIRRFKNTINEIQPYVSISNLPKYLSSIKH